MSEKIFYYSKYGNSELLAECLAEKKAIESVSLKESKKRKGRIGFMLSGYDSVRRKKVELLDNPWNEINTETTLYFIFPIWAGNIAPAMRSFIMDANLEGKEIIGISLQADPNAGAKIEDEFKAMIGQANGEFKTLYNFHGASPGEQQDRSYYEELVTQID